MSFVFKAVKSVVKTVVGVALKVVSTVLGGVGKKGNAKNKANANRLNKQLEPEDFRKIVFGNTAMAVDLRYWEVHGTKFDRYSEVIAGAGHQVEGFDQFYIEDELVTFSGNNATGKFAGVLSKTTNTGAAGNAALSVGSGTFWNSTSKFTGVPHYALAWIVDEKKLPNGVPSRYTQVGRGALVYDPRKDTSRGGSGSHRAENQATWAYATVDSNGQPIGRNNALQMLWYLIGWRVQNPATGESTLVCGRGVDLNDINWAEFIAAANDAEALQYYTDILLSTGDDHSTNESIISADGLIGELLDPGGLWTYRITKDDTADWVVHLTDNDVVQGGEVEWVPEAPFSEKFNEVAGTYIDPSATSLYQSKAYTTVKDAAYATADTRRKRESHSFQNVQNTSLAQKLARIKLNRTRFTGEFRATFNYRALRAQAWNVVKLSLERYAFTEKLFRVVSQSITPAGIEMVLREDDPSIYAGGSVVVPAAPSSLVKYDPRIEIAVEGIAAFATTRSGSGSSAEDGLTVTWNTTPGNVRRTEVQFKRTADTSWAAGFTGQSDQLSSYVGPLLPSSQYTVRVRHVSIHEIPGPWANVNVTTGSSGRVTSAQVAYADGTLIEALKPAQAGANVTGTNVAAGIVGQGALATLSAVSWNTDITGKPAIIERHWDMAYSNITAAQVDIVGIDSSICQIVSTTDTGGKTLEIGDNSGVDGANLFWKDLISYSPNELYEIIFDVEVFSSSAGASLFLGVQALDKANNNLGGSYNYINAVGIQQNTIIGRNQFKAYLKGYTTTSEGSANSTPANPSGLPDGSAFAFGQGGAVKFGPMALINYLGQPGKVRIHSVTISRLPGVMAARPGVFLGDGYIRRADGTTSLTEALAVTNIGTAAAIAGQSPWATYITVTPTGMNLRTSRLRDTDGTYDDLGTVRNRRITRLQRDDGTTSVTEGAVVTNLGTAGAIAGQSPWATYTGRTTSDVNSRLGYVQADGRFLLGSGNGIADESNSFWLTNANAVTSFGTAAAFAGQGALATLNQIDPGTSQFKATGSVPATIPDNSFSYTSNTNSITISWPGITVYRIDGGTVSISAGSQSITGLSMATTYKIYPFVIDRGGSSGTISFVSGGSGSPNVLFSAAGSAAAAASMHSRGNIPMGYFLCSTTASGSGGGGGGGSGACLHPSTLLNINGRFRLAEELKVGDSVDTPNGLCKVVNIQRKFESRWVNVETAAKITGCLVTKDHVFYKATGEHVYALDLKLGDLLRTAGDHVEVTGLELFSSNAEMVILDLDYPHIYCLGPQRLLSHNGTQKP
jgi:hypothetical protein